MGKKDVLSNKPTLIVWGLQDISFREMELNKWKSLFINAEVHEHAKGNTQGESSSESDRYEELLVNPARLLRQLNFGHTTQYIV